MDKQSAYELQKIDCNCNDCGHMFRDFAKYKKSEDWHRQLDFEEFEKNKAKAIADAMAIENESSRNAMLRIANKMTFQFDKSGLMQFGVCTLFKKDVSFIPGVCQLETQGCFEHRKDL